MPIILPLPYPWQAAGCLGQTASTPPHRFRPARPRVRAGAAGRPRPAAVDHRLRRVRGAPLTGQGRLPDRSAPEKAGCPSRCGPSVRDRARQAGAGADGDRGVRIHDGNLRAHPGFRPAQVPGRRGSDSLPFSGYAGRNVEPLIVPPAVPLSSCPPSLPIPLARSACAAPLLSGSGPVRRLRGNRPVRPLPRRTGEMEGKAGSRVGRGKMRGAFVPSRPLLSPLVPSRSLWIPLYTRSRREAGFYHGFPPASSLFRSFTRKLLFSSVRPRRFAAGTGRCPDAAVRRLRKGGLYNRRKRSVRCGALRTVAEGWSPCRCTPKAGIILPLFD